MIMFHISTQATVYFKSLVIYFSSMCPVLAWLLLCNVFTLKSVGRRILKIPEWKLRLHRSSCLLGRRLLGPRKFSVDVSLEASLKDPLLFPAGDVEPAWQVYSAG